MYKIYKSYYSANNSAVNDIEAKVICDKKGRILGARVVGVNAGEIMREYVLAESAGLKITRLSSAIHIYPTIAQVIKRSADQYYMDLLSSGWFRNLSKFFIRLVR